MKNLLLAIAAFFGFNTAVAQEPKTTQKTKTTTDSVKTTTRTEKSTVKKHDAVTDDKKKKKINTVKDTVATKK